MITAAVDTMIAFGGQHVDLIVLAVAAVIVFTVLWRATVIKAGADASASHNSIDDWIWRFPPFA
jgi:hypothetical protein